MSGEHLKLFCVLIFKFRLYDEKKSKQQSKIWYNVTCDLINLW